VRGMADKCLAVIDTPCTAGAVGALYGARSRGGILDGWLVDTVDEDAAVEGLDVRHAPLWMSDESTTAAIVGNALEMA
jgi:LPPG:FO 2-phospho-L-lactate transferase